MPKKPFKATDALRAAAVCIFLLISHPVQAWGSDPNSQRKQKFQLGTSLTFRAGTFTKPGIRGPAVPQLSCLNELSSGGPSACGYTQVPVMQCRVTGFDSAGSAQWKCSGDVEDYYRLAQTDVVCEGYYSKDDHVFVVEGTCACEYGLILTEKGKRMHGYNPGDSTGVKKEWNAVEWIVIVGFVVLVIVVIKRARKNAREEREGYHNGGPDDGHGPGRRYSDYAHHDPPPPYSDHDTFPSAPPLNDDRTGGFRPPPHQCRPNAFTRTEGQQGNDFWRGLSLGGATGGILGYLFGANRNRGYGWGNEYARPRRHWNSGGWGRSVYNEGYNSGYNTGFQSGRTSNPAPDPPVVRESTGFGSTRTR